MHIIVSKFWSTTANYLLLFPAITANGSGKNLLHAANGGSASIIEEEEEPLPPTSTVNGDAATAPSSAPQPKEEQSKSTQSYLALTKLGMGKKEGI